MPPTLIKYRLFFDPAARRCVETVIEWDPEGGPAPDVVCATLPVIDDSEASARRFVDVFFGSGVH